MVYGLVDHQLSPFAFLSPQVPKSFRSLEQYAVITKSLDERLLKFVSHTLALTEDRQFMRSEGT
jgi:hypothetical protein